MTKLHASPDPDAWKQFLAKPDLQLAKGYSARTVAKSCEAADGATLRELGMGDRQQCPGRRINNRAEDSHPPIRRRESKMLKFKSQGSAQRFLAIHAEIYNTFGTQAHLISWAGHRTLRAVAHQAWADATAAPELSGQGEASRCQPELTCQFRHDRCAAVRQSAASRLDAGDQRLGLA